MELSSATAEPAKLQEINNGFTDINIESKGFKSNIKPAKDWSNLAKVVYKRTYARKLENGATEDWNDTVLRVIDGNVKNYRGTSLLEKDEEEPAATAISMTSERIV